MDYTIHAISSIFYIMGAVSTLAGAYAALVFPDVLSRMHGATKPQVLGLFCFCTGYVVQHHNLHIALAMGLVWGMQLLTIPVSAHIVARAAQRTDDFDKKQTVIDELSSRYINAETVEDWHAEELKAFKDQQTLEK